MPEHRLATRTAECSEHSSSTQHTSRPLRERRHQRTLRALRGATTVADDGAPLVQTAVRELLLELIERNRIRSHDVVSAIFSATPDLRSLYPAAVARDLGWTDVPMLCVTEMDVEDAPRHCIRILLHVSVRATQQLVPVYQRDARILRPDLCSE